MIVLQGSAKLKAVKVRTIGFYIININLKFIPILDYLAYMAQDKYEINSKQKHYFLKSSLNNNSEELKQNTLFQECFVSFCLKTM